MATTTNLDLEIPVETDYDTWGGKLDGNRGIIDKALGSVATITTASGTHTLTQVESNHAVLKFTATLTGNLTVDVLASKSRTWVVQNATSGAYTVTFQVAGGGGDSVTVLQGAFAIVMSDGTDCTVLDLSTLGGGRDINPQTGTSYTLVASDARKLITFTNAAPVTLNIPPNSNAPIPVKSQIDLGVLGTGEILVVDPGSGVTLNGGTANINISGQWRGATLVKYDTNGWWLLGLSS